jgi:hypothetical protein
MNPQHAQLQVQAHTDVNSHQQSLANNRLEGRWLILARVLWCATFVLSFAYFIVSMVANTFDPVLTILLFAVTSVWFAVSGVLFWRKSNDRVILLFSLALMLVGGVWLAPFPAAILPLPLIWELPFDTMLFLAQAAFLIFYLFPDGRFVPHWTRWLALAWIVVSLDGNLPSFLSALSAWNSLFSLSIYRIIEVAFLGSLAFAQIYRYRRVATPMQRQQTKWVVYALAIVLVGGSAGLLEFNVISYYFPALALPYQLAQLLSSLTTLLLPVLIPLSIGIAFLRYRLWDIDIVIKRTLVYTSLTVTLVVLYIGCILILQALLSGFTSGNSVALVVSTLGVAALFQPLRRRIQARIDRRFYRRKYDAARIIAAFSSTLRGEVDLNTLNEQLVMVIQETMQPTFVSLWLQRPNSLAQQHSGSLVTMAEQAPSLQPVSPISETVVTETPVETPKLPPPHKISRRAVILGLAAGGVVVASGGLSWWLLKRRASFTYYGHADATYDAAWSPNGQRIASTSKDTTVQIWDATDGSHVFIYRGHQDEVYAASWSPNGKRIASCSKDKTVQVWDAADGGHLFTYRGHKDAVILVAWSPDGKRLASGGGILIEDGKPHDDTVQVWDATDGSHVFTYHGHTDSVEGVVWSPDGKRIASASLDKTVQVWDATDGSHVFTYRGHTDKVFTLAWSPDGKYLASAGADMTVQVWDAVDGKHEFTYTKHTDQVLGVAWSPNSARIVSTSVDKTAQVWDALGGGHVFVYNGHTNWVVTPAWSPDGTRIATTSYDDTVQIWSPG